MTLNNVEKAYLGCLLNGGDIQDVTLSEFNERTHQEIKRLKTKGFVLIPQGTISGTDKLYGSEYSRLLTAHYTGEIRELQKKQAIGEAIGKFNANLPADMTIDFLRYELDRISEEAGRNEIKSASKMQETGYENTEFIIDNILPIGMTLFIGAPKMGKTWLLLLMAECISWGFPFLKDFKLKKVPVLYYTLEDSINRCTYRLNKINGFDNKGPWSKILFFSETARGTVGLFNDIKKTGARVVIIDTFGAFLTVRDGNDYAETTAQVREIKRVADTLKIAILVVHHSRKDSTQKDGDWTNAALGSQGLVGAADSIILLQRKRGEDTAKLTITGRDITDCYINLKWNDGLWLKQN
jgi:hypothetical protein